MLLYVSSRGKLFVFAMFSCIMQHFSHCDVKKGPYDDLDA